MNKTWMSLAVLLALPAIAHAEASGPLSLSPASIDIPESLTATPAPAANSASIVTLDSQPAPSSITPFTSVPRDDKALSLSFEVPLWFSGIEGTIGGKGFSTHVNASFTDILDATDSVIGIGGRLNVAYGNWTFYAAGLYMKLGVDNVTGPDGIAKFSIVNEMGIVDMGIMYRIGEWYLGNSVESPTLRVDGGVGFRYMYLSLEIQDAMGASRSDNKNWIDPVAVGQLTLDLDKNWRLLFRGDIGGGSSDLTWSASALVGYRIHFNEKVALDISAGYGAMGENYSSGSGDNRFVWDVIMSGPILNITLEF